MLDKTNAEAGEVMQCLIEHKNHAEMNRKCTVGIEHHQLVSILLAHLPLISWIIRPVSLSSWSVNSPRRHTTDHALHSCYWSILWYFRQRLKTTDSATSLKKRASLTLWNIAEVAERSKFAHPIFLCTMPKVCIQLNSIPFKCTCLSLNVLSAKSESSN